MKNKLGQGALKNYNDRICYLLRMKNTCLNFDKSYKLYIFFLLFRTL